METLIENAERHKANQYFTVQVSATGNGSDVADLSRPWVSAAEMNAFNAAINEAKQARSNSMDQAYTKLQQAILTFNAAKRADGSDPYFRGDPGPGLQRLPIYEFDLAFGLDGLTLDRTNDGRILNANNPDAPNNGTFTITHVVPNENPFNEQDGLIRLNSTYNPSLSGRTFGGIGLKGVFAKNGSPTTVEVVNSETWVVFDLYYPAGSRGKYMRFEVWSSSSGGAGSQAGNGSNGGTKTQSYIRTDNLFPNGGLNMEVAADINGEAWHKTTITVATPGINQDAGRRWEDLRIDLHTETGAVLDNDILYIGNIRILQLDPTGIPIPDEVNMKLFNEVAPLRGRYNAQTGHFLMGTLGGNFSVSGIQGYHYDIFTDGNNLKAESVHPRAPAWFKDAFGGQNGNAEFNFAGTAATAVFGGNSPEYIFPTAYYQSIRDQGYKAHGHVLAWYNQAPVWMRQIIPENIDSLQWNADGKFYAYGNSATGPYVRVNKELARRVQFNHIMYELRHFYSIEAQYGSSPGRGIIPFHSFDVINEEIHESRHSTLIPANENEWKNALKNLSWLMAMTDNDNDPRNHYIYLLFKYAHIAAPNAQMATKYKANYASLPEYMKIDGHDNNGSIDAYITDRPPILVYNDYSIATYSKARVAFNMIKELNTLWKTDPLYDGRNLIEGMGIQGHDTAGPTLASDNQRSLAMYASLIDQGLLDTISYSELDIKLPESAPGGGALAPAVLNQKQADVVGYQYALLYMAFDKYRNYIDRITNWGVFGSGWQNSYVPFDSEQRANQAYYSIMESEKFILGHSYLDYYFEGEYEKVRYVP
jgi:GH35 family endo-1,4-beta-xylanase